MVWIPSTPAAEISGDAKEMLDRQQMLFVWPFAAGYKQNVFLRRLRLALVGVGAMVNAYKVDASRVYVGGYTDGAQVAQRLAFDYPG